MSLSESLQRHHIRTGGAMAVARHAGSGDPSEIEPDSGALFNRAVCDSHRNHEASLA
jgi:hypothetical protein